MTDLHRLLREASHIAERAGILIERIRAEGFDTASKDDRSPVTRADREADTLLRQELLRLEPVGWLSEETADNEERLALDRLWVVDPLDGTKEFMKGLPEYSVAIALVESGSPLLGVVHNPATGETYSAGHGLGASRNGERIAVREGNQILASRSEIAKGEFEPFEASWEIRPVGSIQYKLSLIAAGAAAVTFSRGPKHEWDVCAGALIVNEAGGIATDLFGDPLRYNQPFPKVKGIMAGAANAYARASEQVSAIGASDRMAELAERPDFQ
ncbi:MAG: 3'(2'),5'-bisphosphate nucleotidase CysQ [Gemmatimonadota bacterium]|nr:MAG: 3'(2'),5'-bisphosphate nucleotidase CysQ [Gemmatimonadota bacterium]